MIGAGGTHAPAPDLKDTAQKNETGWDEGKMKTVAARGSALSLALLAPKHPDQGRDQA